MEPIVIWGASGHAMVVAEIIRLQGRYRVEGFLDNVNPHRRHEVFEGVSILGGEEQLDEIWASGIRNLIIAIGDNRARLHCAGLARAKGFELASAIHPGAVIASSVVLGPGTVVAAGAVINPGARIGENVIVNTASSVDHECRIGDGVHISPGARLAGNVLVGRGAWIGLGACIINGISIGSASVIGAGAVVIRDIPDQAVAYGNPARVQSRQMNSTETDT